MIVTVGLVVAGGSIAVAMLCLAWHETRPHRSWRSRAARRARARRRR